MLVPDPVPLDTSLCSPPSRASFPDTRHRHWAKPRELLELLPCAQLQIAASWIAPSRQPCRPGGLGRWVLCCCQAPAPRGGSPAKQCRYLRFRASLAAGEQRASCMPGGRTALSKGWPSSPPLLLPGCGEEQDARCLSCSPVLSFKPRFLLDLYHGFGCGVPVPLLLVEIALWLPVWVQLHFGTRSTDWCWWPQV